MKALASAFSMSAEKARAKTQSLEKLQFVAQDSVGFHTRMIAPVTPHQASNHESTGGSKSPNIVLCPTPTLN